MDTKELEGLMRMIKHSQGVGLLLMKVCKELMVRSITHDASKVLEEDLDRHIEAAQKKQELIEKHGMTHGDDMDRKFKEEYKDLVEEHVRRNRHHVEYHTNGILDMDLMDVLEMLLDWCQSAADNGDDVEENNSIGINAKKYGIDPQLTCILRNTVRNLRLE